MAMTATELKTPVFSK